MLNSTVLLINYDENDGFFDHVPPPVPPAGTADEFIKSGTPIGLGFRVPMLVISPWSRGGWVNSQVFDHTSVIQFLETWTHRHRQAGDLPEHQRVAARGLRRPDERVRLHRAGLRPADAARRARRCSASRTVARCRTRPRRQTHCQPRRVGTKSARPLPYQPDGYVDHLEFDANNKILVWVKMLNQRGTKSTHFSIYANQFRTGGPWQYTVGAGGTTSDYFNIGTGYGNGQYDLTLFGPNRFLRHFAGNATTAGKSDGGHRRRTRSSPAPASSRSTST